MNEQIDFTDVIEEELLASCEHLQSVLVRLDKLSSNTRMEILATGFPAIYSSLNTNYKLLVNIFEGRVIE
jgi:hypothetical protein